MRMTPQMLAFTEMSENREWLEQLISKLWFPLPFTNLFIYFLILPPHFSFIKRHKGTWILFCWLFGGFLFVSYVSLFFFSLLLSTPTDFWVVSSTCRHIKCLRFIWNLTWGKCCSSTFCFFTVNNNAVISYLQNSFFSPMSAFLWSCGLSFCFSQC